MKFMFKATALVAGLGLLIPAVAPANPEWCSSVGDFVERAAIARQFNSEPQADLIAFIDEIEAAAISRGENRENVLLFGEALRLILDELFSHSVATSREARIDEVRLSRQNYEAGCREGAAE